MDMAQIILLGSALHLFGAPPSRIQFPHGDQEVCLDSVCHVLDVHHTYLNIGNHPPRPLSDSLASSGYYIQDEPVLLFSMDGLNPKTTHNVVFRLIERNPTHPQHEGGIIKGIAFDSFVYTEVHTPRYAVTSP